MFKGHCLCAVLLLVVCPTNHVNAQSTVAGPDPPIPEAESRPSGNSATGQERIRVALVDSGVNYTLPGIAKALARDDDGQLIGYDFWDMDDRPFDAHPARGGRLVRHGTKTASVLIREAPEARLVPYRYPRPDMRRMADLIAHSKRHDVRIIGLPLGGNRPEEWAAFEQAASDNPDILFVASAGNNARDIDQLPVYPASLGLHNLLVVSSADDFVRPAEGVNWGRSSVDYLVPAEQIPVIEFDGTDGIASGSSYAVPRLVALGARLLAQHPEWQADQLRAEFRRRFADGSAPQQVARGYVSDPLTLDPEQAIRVMQKKVLALAQSEKQATSSDQLQPLSVPLDVLQLSPQWTSTRLMQALQFAQATLGQCAISFEDVTLTQVEVPAYLQDLATGPSRTLMQELRRSGPERRLTVVFANDTRMATPFDAEAFGRANTRRRPWLQDSVWLSAIIKDEGIALAHELFHVLANSGAHVDEPGNLMQAMTQGDNTRLSASQCKQARENALLHGLFK